jgi:hypothetical protein
MKISKLDVFAGLVVMMGFTGSARADDPPSFTKDIKPFLTKYCTECHSGTKTKSGVNLESFETIMKGGKGGKAIIVAGDADKSRLVQVIEKTARPMPPKNSKQPEAAEVKLMRAWVAAGAKDDTPKSGSFLMPSTLPFVSARLWLLAEEALPVVRPAMRSEPTSEISCLLQ